jgi:uncharacterized protein
MLLVLCSGCNSTKPNTQAPITEQSVSSAESSSAQVSALHPYPPEFTVDAFRTMALSGTNLVIGNTIERTADWTKYYITYTSNGVKISGTLSLPVTAGAHPLVVQNHGYIDPAIYTNGRGLKREQAAMARAGFAVLHTDYRKHAESDADPDTRGIYDAGLAYAVDSANAVLAVRELRDPRIDASKVGMLGHSMGGGVTLHILAARQDLIDAAVLYAPVHTDAWENFARWRMDDAEAGPTLAFLKTKAENPSAWAALSQTGSLRLIEDPILLFHGTNDKDVPIAWSNELAATAKRLNKELEYIVYQGEGHEFGREWNDFITRTITHFQKYLRP